MRLPGAPNGLKRLNFALGLDGAGGEVVVRSFSGATIFSDATLWSSGTGGDSLLYGAGYRLAAER
jgi:hypothetical protein